MADVASRPHTTDPLPFLHSFSSQFPPPTKDTYWHLCQLPTKITSLQ
jgi:hypothetical protein